MTQNGFQKKEIRRRMKDTGEVYSVAALRVAEAREKPREVSGEAFLLTENKALLTHRSGATSPIWAFEREPKLHEWTIGLDEAFSPVMHDWHESPSVLVTHHDAVFAALVVSAQFQALENENVAFWASPKAYETPRFEHSFKAVARKFSRLAAVAQAEPESGIADLELIPNGILIVIQNFDEIVSLKKNKKFGTHARSILKSIKALVEARGRHGIRVLMQASDSSAVRKIPFSRHISHLPEGSSDSVIREVLLMDRDVEGSLPFRQWSVSFDEFSVIDEAVNLAGRNIASALNEPSGSSERFSFDDYVMGFYLMYALDEFGPSGEVPIVNVMSDLYPAECAVVKDGFMDYQGDDDDVFSYEFEVSADDDLVKLIVEAEQHGHDEIFLSRSELPGGIERLIVAQLGEDWPWLREPGE